MVFSSKMVQPGLKFIIGEIDEKSKKIWSLASSFSQYALYDYRISKK